MVWVGENRRLRKSAAVLAIPGICATSSGLKVDAHMSRAISRAMMPKDGLCGCILQHIVNVATLSVLTARCTRNHDNFMTPVEIMKSS